LLFALSFLLMYCCGLGFLALAIAPVDPVEPPGEGNPSVRILALAVMLGLLINYTIVLLIGSLDKSLIAGSLLSIAGLGHAGFSHKRYFPRPHGVGWQILCGVAGIVFLFTVPILLTPLTDWDARSIWFFHAKLIYFAGGLTEATGLNAPSVQFSHIGYPYFISVLAAQTAHLTGFWNEYLPKTSLLIILIPAVLAGAGQTIKGAWISNIALIALLFLSPGNMLWIGSMDGYLALYATLACISMVRWFRDGEPVDGLITIICLSIASVLKNEGMLIAVLAMVTGAGFLLTSRETAKRLFSLGWSLGAVAGIGFSGMVLWAIKKHLWQLTQSADVAVPHIGRIMERLEPGALSLITQHLLLKTHIPLAAASILLAFAFAKHFKAELDRAVWLPAVFGILYGSGLFAIYLNTPNDLTWHLESSADRTALTIRFSLLCSTLLILRSWEQRKAR
jgi:hypothetical protein